MREQPSPQHLRALLASRTPAEIAAAVASFDVPPRNVEVTLTLFLGSDRRAAEAGRQSRDPATAREVRGVGETLGDFTKWSAYEPLGSQSIAVAEGAPVIANLSADYRVAHQVESVDDRGVVKFRAFTPTGRAGRRRRGPLGGSVLHRDRPARFH